MTPAHLDALIRMDEYAGVLAEKGEGRSPAPSANPAADLAYLASL